MTQNSFAQSDILSKGAEAPTFTAEATLAGNEFTFSLEETLAKGPVVLYFFPAAYTRGCDIEARTFAKLKEKFTDAGTTIIGVSADSIERLSKFSSDPDYCAGEFPVASDPKGDIASTYGLELIPPKPDMENSKGQEINHGFIPRTTFVINTDGTVEAVFSSKYDDISPVQHVKKSLAIVQKL